MQAPATNKYKRLLANGRWKEVGKGENQLAARFKLTKAKTYTF